MAKPSEIKVTKLVNLFEPKAESKPGERIQRALVQQLNQEQEETRHKENPEQQQTIIQHQHVVTRDSPTPSAPLALAHHKSEATKSAEEIVQPSSAVETSKHKQLDKHNQLKELEEQQKISLNENEKLRSQVGSLTEKLEALEASFETLKQEHKKELEASVTHKKLEETAKLIQNPSTDRNEIKSSQTELATEKQTRIEMEKCLKEANMKISELAKHLEETEKQLMLYKGDQEDHIKPLCLEQSGQLSEADEKDAKFVQQLDAVSNKPKNPEIHQNDNELCEKQMKARKNLLKLSDEQKAVLRQATLERDKETQQKQPAKNNGKETSRPVPVNSFRLSEITKVCQPVPNLRCGYNRPKRDKHHVPATSAGTLGQSSEQLNGDI